MKNLAITCFLLLVFSPIFGQHVPTLKPTGERLTKVKSEAVQHFESGLLNFRNKNNAQAKIDFQNAIKADKSFAEAYINLSKVYEAEENLDSSRTVLQSAISSMIPLNERAFAQLGRVTYKQEDYDAAEYNFKQAVSLNNQEDDYHYFVGLSLLKVNNAEEAEVFFKKASELDLTPRNKIGLSNAQIQNEKNEEAIATLQSIPNYESNPEATLNLAIAYHNLNNSEMTDKYLQMAQTNGAGDQAVFQNLFGLIQSEKSNNDEAQKAFNKAIELDDDNATFYNDRASHQIRIENFKDALVDLDKAIELQPDFSKAYYNRGIAKEMMRDEEGACLDWEYAFFLGYVKAEELLNDPICNR
ncbi:MAG: tetratricopeptide repeat protein [Crocinitomicaceae bacterium]|nr:tetratricopeptide repeat protein [Crocinitomicaceae bacterium]